MKKTLILWILILFLITSCTNGTPQPTSIPNGELPTPVVKTTSVPDATATAVDFLTRWEENDYAGMYAMLAPTSRDAITEEDFIKKYQDAAQSLTLKSLGSGILSSLIQPNSAKISYQANFATTLFGDLNRQMEMNLIIDQGNWKIQWDDGLIMPELNG